VLEEEKVMTTQLTRPVHRKGANQRGGEKGGEQQYGKEIMVADSDNNMMTGSNQEAFVILFATMGKHATATLFWLKHPGLAAIPAMGWQWYL